MRDLNRVTLIGNLTRDPEVKQTTTGQSVGTFTVASNRSWTNQTGEKQDAVEYVDCVAWGKLGEIIGQILHKGGRVYVEGRLQTRSWEGQDGVKRYKTEVIVSDFSSFDRAGSSATNSPFSADSNFGNESPAGISLDQTKDDISSPAPQVDIEDIPGGKDEININDIPF
jgi:single-strand DNA-binding protein